MKTYNTYAECKLANPDCDVYEHPIYGFTTVAPFGMWGLSKPKDHLITVEKFLADGNLFVDGDIYLNSRGDIMVIGVDTSSVIANTPSTSNINRFILKTAALEVQDNPNKHPHHDLIIEWAKDTSKRLQIKTLADDVEWGDCSILAVIENPKFLARFKPQREFIEGHWYPCLLNGRKFICEWRDDGYFYEPINANRDGIANIKWSFDFDGLNIGESLGKIKFGGGDV